MAAADTAKLIASLELKDKFSPTLKNAGRALSGFDAKLSQTEGRAFKAGQQIGTGIKNGLKIATVAVGLLTTQVFAGLRQLVQLEEATAATNAALLSTKGVSGQTADSVRKLAEQYENLNAVMDDKVIQAGENVLLTFTNIRKEAFEPALAAALDLSTAMGQDLQSSIVQIGKALNDPAKGFTALRRVGIQFTESQEKQIKALQKSGDLLGAQKIILAELGTEFGGRFAAQGRTGKATIAGIGDAAEDLQKALATGLFPTVQRLLPRFREFLLSPAFAKGASDLGDAIGRIFSEQNITEGVRVLTGFFNTAKSVAPAIAEAAKITGQVVGEAVRMFRSLPPEIQGLAIAGLAINKLTGGLVTNIAGGLISAVLKQLVSGVVNVAGAVVNVVGGAPHLGPQVPDALKVGAGGAALGTGAALGIVAAAAVIVPLVGIALTNALDPQHIKDLTGKAATATARGIPDANNKALQELRRIQNQTAALNQAEDRSYDAIERVRGAIVTTSALAMTASQKLVAAILGGRTPKELRAQAEEARGSRNRIGFVAGGKPSSTLPVADYLTTRFARSQAPFYRDMSNARRALNAIKVDQARAIRTGDTKTAAALGRDIASLQRTIKEKETRLTVNVPITNVINGRIVGAAFSRFTSVVGTRGGGPGGILRGIV